MRKSPARGFSSPKSGATAGGVEVRSEAPDVAMRELDPFDRVQLAFVIKTCRESKTLSHAGRKLFAVSRAKRSKMNDADRLKKYLKRFNLSWEQLQ